MAPKDQMDSMSCGDNEEKNNVRRKLAGLGMFLNQVASAPSIQEIDYEPTISYKGLKDLNY